MFNINLRIDILLNFRFIHIENHIWYFWWTCCQVGSISYTIKPGQFCSLLSGHLYYEKVVETAVVNNLTNIKIQILWYLLLQNTELKRNKKHYDLWRCEIQVLAETCGRFITLTVRIALPVLALHLHRQCTY